VHGYKKMRTDFVAYSRNCLEILDLFFEMSVNMILDGIIKYLYLFLKLCYLVCSFGSTGGIFDDSVEIQDDSNEVSH